MFAPNIHARDRRRRGVVLVLILGMLSLLALIGVTFATFSGQAKVGAQNFAEGKRFPESDEVMDFALSQLINDTSNPMSAIRGHSLKRDMYGNDSVLSFSLTSLPAPDGRPIIATPVTNSNGYVLVDTNIPVGPYQDPWGSGTLITALNGLSFVDWFARLELWIFDNAGNPVQQVVNTGYPPLGTSPAVVTVPQTYQIVADVNNNGIHQFRLTLPSSAPGLVNPYMTRPANTGFLLKLDNRFRRAFNGTGMAGIDHRLNNQTLSYVYDTTTGNANIPYPIVAARYGNFRFNGDITSPDINGVMTGDPRYPSLGNPSLASMDEDYDACDLENWFLAIQSADGQVMIPSFHRPSILSYGVDPADTQNPTAIYNDWTRSWPAANSDLQRFRAVEAMSKILRPRAVDHPSAAHDLPDLMPDPNTGKIAYDVDNDGDGVTDSVWLDLGYSTRRDSSGKLFKPLFSFMVLGLNGRIPLNTAGNLNARVTDPNSPATVGPMGSPLFDHASHLGYSTSEINPKYAFQIPWAYSGTTYNGTLTYPYSGNPTFPTLDVIQLRRLLSGGFPWDVANQAPIYTAPPVPGRWGEADILTAFASAGALPASGYSMPYYDPTIPATTPHNPIGPGVSVPPTLARVDGTDDDYDGMDFFPPFAPPTAQQPAYTSYPEGVTQGYGGPDYADAAGHYVLPSERKRRFVTPFDLAGVGRVVPFNSLPQQYDDPGGDDPANPAPWTGAGFDRYGRVSHFMYYRPPGLPAKYDPTQTPPNSKYVAPTIPDLTNNLYHGYEAARNPLDVDRSAPTTPATATFMGMAPFNLSTDPAGNVAPQREKYPKVIPTFDPFIVSGDPVPDPTTKLMVPVQGMYPGGSLAWNNPDEMNLYAPSQVDAPYGPQDLEWLYRAHDVDGSSLTSRLQSLDVGYWQPSSLNSVGPADYLLRRRLFTTEAWDNNSFAWYNGSFPAADPANPVSSPRATTNPNPNAPANPAANPLWNALLEPQLAHGDRRINLNFPFPLDPRHDEPVRQRWVADTYRMLKSILPNTAIDSPEELAQLSQFLVNVVDYRDADATMTQVANNDVLLIPPDVANKKPARLIYAWDNKDTDFAKGAPLVQYGMEYPPVAINEVLAYTFWAYDNQAKKGIEQARLHVELVNMLTADNADGTLPNGGTASDLDLNGWKWTVAPDDLSGRPDPFTGQVPPAATGGFSPQSVADIATGGKLPSTIKAMHRGGPSYYYMATPFQASVKIGANGPENDNKGGNNAPIATDADLPDGLLQDTATMPPDHYYWIYLTRPANPFDTTSPQVVVDSFRFPYIHNNDSVGGNGTPSPGSVDIYSVQRIQPWRGGQDVPLIPAVTNDPNDKDAPSYHDANYGFTEQTVPAGDTSGEVYGLYADPNKPTDPAAATRMTTAIRHTLNAANDVQDNPWDFLPFNDRDFTSVAELMMVPSCPPGLFTKLFVEHAPPSHPGPVPTGSIVGAPSPNYYRPAWTTQDGDTYPFDTPPNKKPHNTAYPSPNGPPPVLNKKPNYYDYVGRGLDRGNRSVQVGGNPTGPGMPPEPRVYPYLSDAFFYHLGATDPIDATLDQTGSCWFKFLEVFDVPPPTQGAIGPVASGNNLDWFRQDTRPGQVNLNLIIDEEVFFGLIDDPRLNLAAAVPLSTQPTQAELATAQATYLPRIVTQTNYSGGPTAFHYVSDTSLYPQGRGFSSPTLSANYYSPYAMKGAFADFLKLRHGGSVNLFGFGTGAIGAPLAAERPYRSPSYLRINPLNAALEGVDFTVLRPAKLDYTPDANSNPAWTSWSAKRMAQAADFPPSGGTYPKPLRNWPAVPPRRLFALPDTVNEDMATLTGPMTNPAGLGANDQGTTLSNPYGALTEWQATALDSGVLDPYSTATPQANYKMYATHNLGNGLLDHTANPPPRPLKDDTANIDRRQHPYFRSEWLQKVMNLSTVRTHQFAVWITVGFFEVVKEGDPELSAAPAPYNLAAADQLGPELGGLNGRNVRYRSFFIVDRTRATGFNPALPGDFHECVVYRRKIE